MQVQSHADREALADLVAAGQHVTLLGSSWNAVELANHLSDVARQHGWSSSVTLLFPEGAPMAKQVRLELRSHHYQPMLLLQRRRQPTTTGSAYWSLCGGGVASVCVCSCLAPWPVCCSVAWSVVAWR